MTTKKIPDPVVKSFAANLRRVRVESGTSQSKVAKLTELHRTEVSLLERGQREPRLGTMLRLAGALEVPVEALVSGLEWRPSIVGDPSPSGFYIQAERVADR